MRPSVRTLLIAATAALALVPRLATAQGLFSPAYIVNDKIVTNFEIDQRAKLLTMLRAPGDPAKVAREQLIEERLKLEAAQVLGFEPAPDEVEVGMAEFAGRVNMDTEQFLRAIGGGGVAPESFRAFVEAGLAWRNLIQARFAPKVQVSDRDIDRAIQSATAGSDVRVLLSEIILPAPPQEALAAQARAAELVQITSPEAFSSAARRYSASATQGNGGRLNWMPITNLPPALRPAILGLAPGQVTEPIPLEGAIALFQLRGIEETGVSAPEYASIEYAALYIPGGRSESGLAEAARIKAKVDTCDDLYGINIGKPEEQLERGAKKPGEIPQDVALELAKLDRYEVSTALTRSNGETLVFLMLCDSTLEIAADAERESIRAQLQNKRLESLSNGYLAELRADARIIEQ